MGIMGSVFACSEPQQKKPRKYLNANDLGDVSNTSLLTVEKVKDYESKPDDLYFYVQKATYWQQYQVRQLHWVFEDAVLKHHSDMDSRWMEFEIFEKEFMPKFGPSLFNDFKKAQNHQRYMEVARTLFSLFLEKPTDECISYVRFICVLSNFCQGSSKVKSNLLYRIFNVDTKSTWGQDEAELFCSLCRPTDLPERDVEKSSEDDEEVVQNPVPKAWSRRMNRLKKNVQENQKLTEKQFYQFCSRHIDVNQLFTDFNLVPSNQEEKMIIQQLLDENPMEVGQTWYVIAAKWWNLWREYVRFEEGDSEGTNFSRPISIDNTPLLEKNSENLELRINIQEGSDFSVIPAPVWSCLQRWYGGSPPLPREVVAFGNRRQKRVDLFPLFADVNVIRARRDLENTSRTTETVCMSEYSPLVEVLNVIRKALKISESMKRLRLWLVTDDETVKLIYSQKEGACAENLQDLAVQRPVQLAVDIQNENNKFQISKSTKISLKSDFEVGMEIEYRHQGNWLPAKISDIQTGEDMRILFQERGSKNGRQKWVRRTTSAPNGWSKDIRKRDNKGGSKSRQSDSPARGSKAGAKRGVVGLKNLGNTCFMNSSLQCLNNTPVLCSYFHNGTWKSEVNKKNPLGMGGKLALEYSKLVKDMWDGEDRYVDPRAFKKMIGNFAPTFIGYRQQDSHEFLAYLLDGIHEDLNRVRSKPFVDRVEAKEGESDLEVSQRAWKAHTARNQSIIVDLFQGQLKSTVVCPDCNIMSRTFDPYMFLSVPVPGQTSQVLTVDVFRLKKGLPVRYAIKVPKMSTIDDLRSATARVAGIREDSLKLVEVYACTVFRQLPLKKHISNIGKGDLTMAYEQYQWKEKENFIQAQILNKRPKAEGKKAFFGMPIFIIFPERFNSDEIHELVEKRLRLWLPDAFRDNGDPPYKIQLRDKSGTQPLRRSRNRTYTMISIVVTWNAEVLSLVQEQTQQACLDNQYEQIINTNKSKRSVGIYDCLKEYCREETLSEQEKWYCSKCKDHKCASKKFDIWTTPEILIIQIKRFHQIGYRRDKITTLVEFPIRGLDMSELCVDGNVKGESRHYDLFAVSNHMGGIGGGHYTAYARNPDSNIWYEFNDKSVSRVSENEIVTAAAYVLFYRRKR